MPWKDFQQIGHISSSQTGIYRKVLNVFDSQIYTLRTIRADLTPEQYEQVLSELRQIASLESPYLTKYHHSFFNQQAVYIAMDMVQDNLEQEIRKHKEEGRYFEENQIWKMLIEVCLGLWKLHSIDFRHHELCPQRIKIDKNGTYQLRDMQTPTIFTYKQRNKRYELFRMKYTPPEMLKSSDYTSKSEIWSLGFITHEMAMFSAPFQVHSISVLYQALTKGEKCQLDDRWSAQLRQVVAAMLEWDVEKRIDTRELLQRLTLKTSQLGLSVSTSPLSMLHVKYKVSFTKHWPNLMPRYDKNAQSNRNSRIQSLRVRTQGINNLHPITPLGTIKRRKSSFFKVKKMFTEVQIKKDRAQEPKESQRQRTFSEVRELPSSGARYEQDQPPVMFKVRKHLMRMDDRVMQKGTYNFKCSPKHSQQTIKLPRLNL